ncbi:MAG: carbon-nitrogen hydrolase family protein [Gammaproteobacteria bacterium]|nr:carbon-nitrogen hydrolase family protein [Gammaproteobacteria bacterium]
MTEDSVVPVEEPTIGVIQMVSSQRVDVNLKRAEALIKEAASEGVKAVFLPENFAALGSTQTRSIAEREATDKGPVRQFLVEQAQRYGCWIFGGTLPVPVRLDGSYIDSGRVRAASFVYDGAGRQIGRYDKRHMFDVDVDDNQKSYRESDTFEPGDQLVVVDSPIGQVGLSVCYDIRFADLYRALFLRGAECFAVPSAFTTVTGEAHFEVLMRARAVENFSYCIASCQGGIHDSGRMTHGHSMVVGPWGDIIASCTEGESVIKCKLDLASLHEIRKEIPIESGFKYGFRQ